MTASLPVSMVPGAEMTESSLVSMVPRAELTVVDRAGALRSVALLGPAEHPARIIPRPYDPRQRL